MHSCKFQATKLILQQGGTWAEPPQDSAHANDPVSLLPPWFGQSLRHTMHPSKLSICRTRTWTELNSFYCFSRSSGCLPQVLGGLSPQNCFAPTQCMNEGQLCGLVGPQLAKESSEDYMHILVQYPSIVIWLGDMLPQNTGFPDP